MDPQPEIFKLAASETYESLVMIAGGSMLSGNSCGTHWQCSGGAFSDIDVIKKAEECAVKAFDEESRIALVAGGYRPLSVDVSFWRKPSETMSQIIQVVSSPRMLSVSPIY